MIRRDTPESTEKALNDAEQPSGPRLNLVEGQSSVRVRFNQGQGHRVQVHVRDRVRVRLRVRVRVRLERRARARFLQSRGHTSGSTPCSP